MTGTRSREGPIAQAILSGLVLMAIVPAGPAWGEATTDWVVEDPVGDARFLDGDGPILPATPFSDAVDLRRVTILEDSPQYLVFALELGTFVTPGDQWVYTGVFNAELTFQLERFSVGYHVRAVFETVTHPDRPAPLGLLPLAGSMCILATPGQNPDEQSCYAQRIDVVADASSHQLRLLVPKPALAGKGDLAYFYRDNLLPVLSAPPDATEPPMGTPPVIERGAVIHDLRARIQPRQDSRPNWYDEAPNEGGAPTYTLRTPMANLELRMVREGYGGVIPLAGARTFSVALHNDGLQDRTVHVEARLRDDPVLVSFSPGYAGSDRHFNVSTPEDLRVPAGSWRRVVFAVHADPESLRAYAILELTATSLEEADDVAAAELRVWGGASPTLDEPFLYLHHAPRQDLAPGVETDLFCLADVGCSGNFFSPLLNDPKATPGSKAATASDLFRDQVAEFWWGWALGRPWALDLERPIVASLMLSSDLIVPDQPVQVAWTNYGITEDGQIKIETFAIGNATATLGPQPTRVEVPMEVARGSASAFKAEFLPQSLEVRFPWRVTAPQSLLLGAHPGAYYVHGGESRLELPLRSFPVEAGMDPTDSLVVTAAPSNWTRATSSGMQIGPGETRLVNAPIFNEGDRQDLNVVVTPASGWRAEVIGRPVASLGTHEGIHFGVLVTAPSDAAEGAKVDLAISFQDDATEELLARVDSSFWVQSIAPAYSEVGVFRPGFVERDVDADPGKGGGLPGFTWAAAMGAALGLVVARRGRLRRR